MARAMLGAVALFPLEVAGRYQTIASGGLRTPLRAMRSVTDAHGEPRRRYHLSVTRASAGFDGRRLAVMWLGRDDDAPAVLTSALQRYMDWMAGLRGHRLSPTAPADIEWRSTVPRGRAGEATRTARARHGYGNVAGFAPDYGCCRCAPPGRDLYTGTL